MTTVPGSRPLRADEAILCAACSAEIPLDGRGTTVTAVHARHLLVWLNDTGQPPPEDVVQLGDTDQTLLCDACGTAYGIWVAARGLPMRREARSETVS